MVLTKLSVIFVICALWFHVECMVVKFERARVVYLDDDYMFNTTVFVRRYSRKTPHYLHIIANTRHLWNNNITVDIIFDQFLHNEYRPSFVELHHKFCDFIHGEPWVGGMLKMFGLTCPLNPVSSNTTVEY
ncbi:unnamed protein product [Arctia plantaginis]|uniref:Vomeronasal type 2 receptor n=1 Tax=Arctia plantaginis TaxID=874455 RepID=A0A8S1APL8_ARCPL|nr:unnamed protein product [Arctia plantaginis]CAB3252039.1 unnamed protein product [Arctia plantaginis]